MNFVLPIHWAGAFCSQTGPWHSRPEGGDLWKRDSHAQDETAFSFLLPLFLSSANLPQDLSRGPQGSRTCSGSSQGVESLPLACCWS